MTTDLFSLKRAIENSPVVTIHHMDENHRAISIACSYGQEIMMVGDSIIMIALAVREHGRTRARLVPIELPRVLMVITEYPLTRPNRMEKLLWVRGSDGRFENVRTEERVGSF